MVIAAHKKENWEKESASDKNVSTNISRFVEITMFDKLEIFYWEQVQLPSLNQSWYFTEGQGGVFDSDAHSRQARDGSGTTSGPLRDED